MSRLLVVAALTLLSAGPASTQGGKKTTPATDKQVAKLITKLGDALFEVREGAYKALVKIGKPALPRLRKAAQGGEPEIQMRARKAIKEIEAQPAPPPKRGGEGKKEGSPTLLEDRVQMTNISETARVASRVWEGPTVTIKDKQGKAKAVVLRIRLQATLADLAGGEPTGQVELFARWQTDATFGPAGLRGTFRLVEEKNGRALAIEGLPGGKVAMRYQRTTNELRLNSDRKATRLLGDLAIDFSGRYKVEQP